MCYEKSCLMHLYISQRYVLEIFVSELWSDQLNNQRHYQSNQEFHYEFLSQENTDNLQSESTQTIDVVILKKNHDANYAQHVY